MTIPPFLLANAEQTLNRILHLDQEALTQLSTLTDKVIAIDLREQDTRFYIFPHAEGLHLTTEYAATPDAEVSATPFTLLRLLATGDSTMLGEVSLTGDTGSARRLMEILQNLELDWEEQLAKLLGDMPAHWFGNLLRTSMNWLQTQATTTRQNFSDYAREELRILPSKPETQAFMDDVDIVRADADRLEQRIRRLENKVQSME